MTKQFGRVIEVIIDRLQLNGSDFTIRFNVPFDDDTDPNESWIEIYNLKDSTINAIKRNQKVTLNAGYEKDKGVILSGYVSKLETKRSGHDKVTIIHCLDSAPPNEKKTVKKSYKANIKGSQIVRDLASIIRLNLAAVVLPNDRTYVKGYTVNGPALEALKNVAKDCGAIVYINKSQGYVRSLKSGDDTRFVLKSETGLIGSPDPFEEEDEDGKVIKGYSVQSLLQHRLTTASIIDLDSIVTKGRYRVRRGVHRAEGQNFITEMELI